MKKTEFGSLFTFIRNGMNVKQDKSGCGLPITRIETISDSRVDPQRVGFANLSEDDCSNWLLRPGDILFSHINSVEHIGKCAIYEGRPEKLVHGMNLLCLRCDPDEVVPEYAKVLIRSPGFRACLSKFINKAVNQASVSIGNLKAIKVEVPCLNEQRRIAATLDKGDELRANRQVTLLNLRSLCTSWFAHLFGDPLGNTKKWPVVPLGELANYVSSGVTPLGGSTVYTNNGVLFIRSQNVLMGELDLSDAAYITPSMHDAMRRTWVKNGDVLLNITGASIGRVALYKGKDDTANVNQHVCIIRLDRQRVVPEYISATLGYPSFNSHIVKQNAGATRQAFNYEQVRNFIVPLPPVELQSQFATVLDRVEEVKRQALHSHAKINDLLASLQQRAFRGGL